MREVESQGVSEASAAEENSKVELLAPLDGSVSAKQLILCLERELHMTLVNYAALPYLVFLVLFTVYMGLMYMSERDDEVYHMNTVLRKNLMEDEMFKKIDTHDDFYAWLNATAKNFWVTEAEYIQAVADRGPARTLSNTRTLLVGINRVQTGNGLFAERQNYPLHFMMLRQKRVQTQNCGSRSKQAEPLHPELWQRIEKTCIDKLSESDTEEGPLRKPSRLVPKVNTTHPVPYTTVTTDPFLTDGKKVPPLPPMRASRGRTHTYTGDDNLYSAKLPYQELFLGDVESIVSDLKANDWIDFTTRVVVVETMVYNAVLRRYVVLRYVVEFLHSGHVTTFSTSEPFWLMLLDGGGWHVFAFMCDCVFCVYFLYSLFELIGKLYLSVVTDQEWYVITDYKPWHLIHLASLAVCLGFRFELWRRSHNMPSDMSGTDLSEELLLYQELFAWAKDWSIAALLVTYLRFYEYIRYWGPLHTHVTETIRLAEKNLLIVMGLICLITFGFALVANVIYGWHLKEFDTIACSFAWLLRSLIAGDIRLYYEMRELEPWWTPIFLLVYRLITWLILLNVVLGILAASFNESRPPPKAKWSDVLVHGSADVWLLGQAKRSPETTIQIVERGERLRIVVLERVARLEWKQWAPAIKEEVKDAHDTELSDAERDKRRVAREAKLERRLAKFRAQHDDDANREVKEATSTLHKTERDISDAHARAERTGMIEVPFLWKGIFCILLLREFLRRQRDRYDMYTNVLGPDSKLAFEGLAVPVTLVDIFEMRLSRPQDLKFWSKLGTKKELEWRKLVTATETERMIRVANLLEVKSVRSAKRAEGLRREVSYLTHTLSAKLLQPNGAPLTPQRAHRGVAVTAA